MPTSSRKPKQFSVKVYDRQHLRNLSARLRQVQALIDDAATKATRIAVRTGYTDTSKDFRFNDFPQARREIDTLFGELAKSLTVNVQSANSEAWSVANAKNDAMVGFMLGAAGDRLDKRVTRRWYNQNTRALNAFNQRVADGMDLSSNVWRLDDFKTELELALEMGLGRGKAAAELSRDVRSFLKHPDKLFRRVRDEKGNLRLSRAAASFHPGQGVYRSSYKNALRLTASETNMAYRSADSKRWQQIDFVLGQHIEPSKNHPIYDICDELQGDYPKDFIFIGWHPFCKCFAVPKLPTVEEFLKYQQAILEGEDVSEWDWGGEVVEDVPGGFKSWVEDNTDRISRAKSLPYFIKDNQKYIPAAKERMVQEVGSKVERVITPPKRLAYASFEPFSPIVIEKLREHKDLKRRLQLFDEIINDERATVLSAVSEAKSVVFPGHKGSQHETWRGIRQMAKDINRAGESVAFLPELDRVTSADALVLFRGRPAVADFKYCVTTKANTLAGNLEDGFRQAGTVVVKLENMDAGVFRDAIEYLKRKNFPCGNIKLINEYGEIAEITFTDIRSGKYKKKIKGFL